MVPIFIASTTPYSGKTFIALGLALKLREEGFSVGYCKPVGTIPVMIGKRLYDADAVFIKEALELPEPLDTISPFVLDYEAQTRLFTGSTPDAKARVLAAFKSLKAKDFVLLGGPASLFEGGLLNIHVLSLMTALNARVLMVEPWAGEITADTLFGMRKLLGKRFLGGVINKVAPAAADYVKDTVRPFLEKSGVKVLGVFPRDKFLGAISVRQLTEVLNGKVLCGENQLDEFIENFSIGAMDVDSALSYFRRTPNKAVITGAHRSDIQLAAMETSTRCIIVTGGLSTNDVVIGKAQMKGVPIISVSDDTFTTIDKIEATLGKTRIREKAKIDRARELLDLEFDLKRLLKSVKI